MDKNQFLTEAQEQISALTEKINALTGELDSKTGDSISDNLQKGLDSLKGLF